MKRIYIQCKDCKLFVTPPDICIAQNNLILDDYWFHIKGYKLNPLIKNKDNNCGDFDEK